MHAIIDLFGGSLPFLLILTSVALYLQSRSEREKASDKSATAPPLCWDGMDDRRLTYATMPLDKLVPLFCNSRPGDDSKQLMAHELKTRGWVERKLANGRTVLVEPAPATHKVWGSIPEETITRIRAALKR